MPSGDCFQAAANYLLDQHTAGREDLILVHAEVAGQGALEGVNFGHAFVLDGETVIDVSNGRNLRMPKITYYALGKIDLIDNVYGYSHEDLVARLLKYKHYGPWDLKTSTGL